MVVISTDALLLAQEHVFNDIISKKQVVDVISLNNTGKAISRVILIFTIMVFLSLSSLASTVSMKGHTADEIDWAGVNGISVFHDAIENAMYSYPLIASSLSVQGPNCGPALLASYPPGENDLYTCGRLILDNKMIIDVDDISPDIQASTNGNFDIFAGQDRNLNFGSGGNTPLMTIASDGKVGIGTSAPKGKLSFDNSFPDLPVDDYNEYKLLLFTDYTPQRSYGMGISSYTMWFNTHAKFAFLRDGGALAPNIGIGTANPESTLNIVSENPAIVLDDSRSPGTKMVIATGSDYSAIASDSYLVFATASDNTITQPSGEKMRITKDGNVGIGVTDPKTTLQIKNSDYAGHSTNSIIDDYNKFQILIHENSGGGYDVGDSYGMGKFSNTFWFNSYEYYKFYASGDNLIMTLEGTTSGDSYVKIHDTLKLPMIEEKCYLITEPNANYPSALSDGYIRIPNKDGGNLCDEKGIQLYGHVSLNNIYYADLVCPSGYTAISGGGDCTILDGGSHIYMSENRPLITGSSDDNSASSWGGPSDRAWRISCHNSDRTGQMPSAPRMIVVKCMKIANI